jgi:hypothetical protein
MMALTLPMNDAVAGEVALSAEYNKLIDNILDLDARLGPVVASPNANSRLGTLEARTTDTGTAPGGIGNQQLANRFGTGVGTTTNVTTGTATAQLTDIRSRLTAAEGAGADACYVYQTVAQAVSTGTFIIFGAEAFDTNNMWDSGGLTTRVTIQKDGIYIVSGMVGYAAKAPAGNNRRLAQVFRNGAAVQGMTGGMPTQPTGFGNIAAITPTAALGLFVGDYLQLSGYADDTPNSVVTAGFNSFLSVIYQRPLP